MLSLGDMLVHSHSTPTNLARHLISSKTDPLDVQEMSYVQWRTGIVDNLPTFTRPYVPVQGQVDTVMSKAGPGTMPGPSRSWDG